MTTREQERPWWHGWVASILYAATCSHLPDPKQFTSLYASTVMRSTVVYSLGFWVADQDCVFRRLFGRCFDSVDQVPREVRVEWISRMMSNANCAWMMQGIVREFLRYDRQRAVVHLLTEIRP